jgi:hypothetical protein
MSNALQLALGRHPHLIQRINQAKPLVARAARQLVTQPAIILRSNVRRIVHRNARRERCLNFNCSTAVGLPGPDDFPVAQGEFNKIPFHTTLPQKRIDLFQTLAQSVVVNVPDNSGQLRTKFLRERDQRATHKLVYGLAHVRPAKSVKSRKYYVDVLPSACSSHSFQGPDSPALRKLPPGACRRHWSGARR